MIWWWPGGGGGGEGTVSVVLLLSSLYWTPKGRVWEGVWWRLLEMWVLNTGFCAVLSLQKPPNVYDFRETFLLLSIIKAVRSGGGGGQGGGSCPPQKFSKQFFFFTLRF